MINLLTPKAAFKEALPTIFSYIGISATFGIIGQSSGLNLLTILLISIIVYAGAAQFVLVGADVKIMDSFFRHRELPDSENFPKPGFQLKTA